MTALTSPPRTKTDSSKTSTETSEFDFIDIDETHKRTLTTRKTSSARRSSWKPQHKATSPPSQLLGPP
eukprot:CAMPEP_0194047576 /NCGR_PEP_ID=MMETSP0009_2-20130614/25054_1 /TAXON_ID=210454 /ORGANISM="Grammatophora oceanica, Strain CCMP 410" /LENGTH=67 /DNA_ID=CAMNT_0038693237 /DNA_START=172 /DNA_END=371 /DNA_ORIENTATION=-